MPIENTDYPNIPEGGGVVLIKRNTMARLIRLMRRGRARGGAKTQERVTDNGTFIDANPGRAGEVDFQLFDASTYNPDGSINQKRVRVKSGTVTDTNFAVVFPARMNALDDPQFILNVGTNSGVVYLHLALSVDSDTGVATINTAEVIAAATRPMSSRTDAYYPLGGWSLSGDGRSLIVYGARGDLSYLYCGAEHYFWTASVL